MIYLLTPSCHPEHREGSVCVNVDGNRFFANAQNDTIFSPSVIQSEAKNLEDTAQLKVVAHVDAPEILPPFGRLNDNTAKSRLNDNDC